MYSFDRSHVKAVKRPDPSPRLHRILTIVPERCLPTAAVLNFVAPPPFELAGVGQQQAGLADEVGAHQGDREGHLLDGEGGGDAAALERVADLGVHPELTEGGHSVLLSWLLAPSGLSAGRRCHNPCGRPGTRSTAHIRFKTVSVGCEHD